MLKMLLLKILGKLLHLAYSFSSDIEGLLVQNWPLRQSVELSLSVQAEPEEGFNVCSNIELITKHIACFKEALMCEEVCEEVDFDNQHAYHKLDDEYVLAGY